MTKFMTYYEVDELYRRKGGSAPALQGLKNIFENTIGVMPEAWGFIIPQGSNSFYVRYGVRPEALPLLKEKFEQSSLVRFVQDFLGEDVDVCLEAVQPVVIPTVFVSEPV